jgi:hypothetical protein
MRMGSFWVIVIMYLDVIEKSKYKAITIDPKTRGANIGKKASGIKLADC